MFIIIYSKKMCKQRNKFILQQYIDILFHDS